MQRSFASLTPQEVLQVAISIEDRNAELYHRFAEMFTEFADSESLEIASVFWEMAIEERHHSWQLRQRYEELYGDRTGSISERELSEIVEVPKLDDGDIFGASNRTLPARLRALNVALGAELAAQQFYAKLVEQTARGALQDIFRYLSQVEDGHVAYLEEKLAQNEIRQPSVQ
ncbi:MAG TPA: ferritin family protein [Terriglobales bacterium]|nr:ferritin family protein [Terriglobales bacterium]